MSDAYHGNPVTLVDPDTGLAYRATSSAVDSGTGGISSTARLLSAAGSTNATLVKNAPGRVYSIQGYNPSAAKKYLKLYNKASAPTVGTDTPKKTIALPPGAAFVIEFPTVGYYFDTGIAFAITGAIADADTTALTAGDIEALNIDYA